MLGNGLGELLNRTAPEAGRFVDLFSGSGAVGSFVASRHEITVLSADLQEYSQVLSAAIIERTKPVRIDETWNRWLKSAQQLVMSVECLPEVEKVTQKAVKQVRAWCESRDNWVITQAYGGHYFSPKQSIWIDALRQALPTERTARTICLAALIEAASDCAAAPGHTAQPFQPTKTAKRFLQDAWMRDVPSRVATNLANLNSQHAKIMGRAIVADAVKIASQLNKDDLVFIDPPYSGVHYSRFYHVLETIASGNSVTVSGVGRYPDQEQRPRSDFSMSSTSEVALNNLFEAIAKQKASAIVTFPDHECSNGLSGHLVLSAAKKHFAVERKMVASKFSSLGGTSGSSLAGSERSARLSANELILTMRPK